MEPWQSQRTNQCLRTFLTGLRISARPNIRETAYLCYSSVIRNHVNPHVGGVRLSKLRPAHVQGMHAALQRNGVSARMRQLVHAVSSRALKQAVRLGTIPRNPCEAVDRPRVPRKEMTALDAAQAEKLLQVAQADPLGALYITASETGARQGELLGLKWEDIDCEARRRTRELSQLSIASSSPAANRCKPHANFEPARS